jgi:chemotaxis protein CheD
MTQTYGPQELQAQGVASAHLKIGECIFTRKNLLISTVLGSCVAATFYHEKTRTGAMFHAMLPDSRMSRTPTASCKFADTAIDNIMRRYRQLEIPRRQITVKLFGGGFTIQPERKRLIRDVVDVGKKNVDMARLKLAEHGLEVVSENVLGERGRKVFFYTGTGEVWMKIVRPENDPGRLAAFPA